MKIVITGALGHIGSRLIREIPTAFPQAEIVMIDNLYTQRFCSLFNLPETDRYRFVEADVLKDDLTSIFSGSEMVIHLAAITDAAGSFEIREQVEQVNHNGSEIVARECLKNDCALIFISTTSVYGTQDEMVDEDCPITDLKPQSPYAESKLKTERMLHEMKEKEGLRFITCRFGTIFGTSIGMRFHTVVNKFCWQAVMEKPITVWRTALHQYRPYLELNDAVNAIQFIMERNVYSGQVYNVLTVNETVNSIVEIISHHVPELSIQYVDTKIMNQLSYHVSNSRFKDLGFDFKGDLNQGISDTIGWLQGARSHRETKIRH